LLHGSLPYDPQKDFAPISLTVEDFLSVAVAPTLGVSSLKELVLLAAAKPGDLNYYAVPGSPYLSWLAFQKRAGISMVFVPYKAPAGALNDLSESRIHVMVTPLATVRGLAQSDKIKLLAVTNGTRAVAAPDVPTAGEAGYLDFTFAGLLGLFGPKDMPEALQERLSAEVRDILRESAMQQRLTNLGLLARGTTPGEFRAVIDAQRAKWAAIAQAHDIKPKR
jgi:tripartite-type tricarboxylate transporter receptor subunit TctC